MTDGHVGTNATDMAAGAMERLQSQLGERVLSESQFMSHFTEVLCLLAQQGIWFSLTVEFEQPAQPILYRLKPITYAPVQNRTETVTVPTRKQRAAFSVVISYALSADVQRVGEYIPRLEDLVLTYWSSRCALTLLPRWTESNLQTRLRETLRARKQQSLVICHIDIDNFKAVNSEFNESGGDAVLREFADRLRSAFDKHALIVRKGGEEFSLFFLDSQSFLAIIPRVEDFMVTMASEAFVTIKRPVTCSVGISYDPEFSAFNGLHLELDKAIKASVQAKQDGRGRFRLFRQPSCTPSPQIPDKYTICGCIWRSRNLSTNFASAFSNECLQHAANRMAVKFARERNTTTVASEVIEHLGLHLSSAALLDERLERRAASTEVHPLDFASAVVGAFFRCAADDSLTIPPDQFFSIHITPTSISVESSRQGKHVATYWHFAFEHDQSTANVIHVGAPWYFKSTEHGVHRSNQHSLSPILFLAVGDHSINPSLKQCASEVLRVDDSPVITGGLPDFWQSNLGKIFRALQGNPNILTIVCVGEGSSVKRTLRRLQSRESWDAFELASAIGQPVKLVKWIKERPLAIHVPEAHDLCGVVSRCLTDLRCSVEMCRPVGDCPSAILPPVRLDRARKLDCSVQTFANGYPRVLVCLASSVDPQQVFQDAYQRQCYEVFAFKIRIAEPKRDLIPGYWLPHLADLEEYVRENFGATGRFGSAIQAQKPDLITEITASVRSRSRTRKLYVPVFGQQRWNMGLIGFHVLPTFHGTSGVCYISFIWIWRSVEASVGFPFSVFGSVKHSEAIVSQVRQETNLNVELGPLTYVASNFHMFCNDTHLIDAIVKASCSVVRLDPKL